MKCEKIHPYLSEMAAGELQGGLGLEIHEHVEGCADCRGRLESTRRLRSLLSLKRAEKPDEFFLRTFVAEFHRRLLADMVRKPDFFRQMWDALATWWESARILPRPAYGLAAIAALVIFLGLYAIRSPLESVPPRSLQQPKHLAEETVVEVPSRFNHLIMANNQAGGNRVYVMDRVDYEPAAHAPVIVQF